MNTKAKLQPLFPDKILLFNPVGKTATLMRSKRPAELSHKATSDKIFRVSSFSAEKPPSSINALDLQVECYVCDAVLMSAVYLEFPARPPESFAKMFLRAKLTVRVDDVMVVNEQPVGDYLKKSSGRLPPKTGFDYSTDVLFRAYSAELYERDDPGSLSGTSAELSRIEGAVPSGYFLTNGTLVKMEVSGISSSNSRCEVRLKAGLISSVYTTRE